MFRIKRLLRLIQLRPSTAFIVRLFALTIAAFIFAEMLFHATTMVSKHRNVLNMARDVKDDKPHPRVLVGLPVAVNAVHPIVHPTDPKPIIVTTQITKLQYGLETPIDKNKALLAGKLREKKGHLTLGIPTVHRDNGTYLMDTVKSLIACMTQAEHDETTIVIFLADFDGSLKELTLQALKREFQGYMNMGLVRVIGAPRSFYPSFDGLKRTYDHPEKKVKWRSKQNYDYAYLFKYSVDVSEYYMQLEDDVMTIRTFVQITKDFIASQKKPWVCLELSELGYIGKVYHSSDLEQLAKTMMLFFQEQPPDVTFIYFNILLLQFQRIIRIPTIFQHMGYHSSLAGKVQTLKDTHFDDTSKQYNGDNPPASIFTNFTTYEPYKPLFAYAKSYGYFWAQYPKNNSYYLLVFDRPEKIKRIVITTGSIVHDTDILHNGIVELSPTLLTKTETSAQCANYVYAGNFTTNGRFEASNVSDLMRFDVFCVRLRMTSPQVPWIVFREIAIFIFSR